MTAPARAIAWEFRRRHLWALPAYFGYLLVLAGVKVFLHWPDQTVRLNPPDGHAAAVTVPLTAAFCYYLAVFSFGVAGDLAARRSIYPARMFALPVTTGALAGWPMLVGSAAMVSLWLGTVLFARWSWGIDLPVLWPSLLCVVFLGWTQALMWMPYGVPGVRVAGTVLWLASLDAVVLLAVYYKLPAATMVAILAPQVPLAYLTARSAVARARRGEVPDWRGAFAGREALAGATPRGRDFGSATRAQAWLEWRRHGHTLPALVAIALPFELAVLFLVRHDPAALVFEILFFVLCTPPLMAGFVAPALSRADSSFTMTRPMTSAALIAARLKMTMWSTIAAWLLVLVALGLTLALAGLWPMLVERSRRFAAVVGAPRAIVVGLLALAGLMGATWRQLVQGLCVGLTGRSWVIRANAALVLAVFVFIGPVLQWLADDSGARGAVWESLPWIFALVAVLKLSAGAWTATRLFSSRLLSDRALLAGAAYWLAAVLALYGVLAWLASTPHVPRHVLMLLAILGIPLARLSAAPLAHAWNRHQ